ncbi:hypothetical protein CYMTET_4127 [Cymbomonas tetramitiformis]|uniref:DUF4218 domain-containing protein n=1 Tax=Cymbomonas tetramitiformis TaxID=36881 RepID=A0AAE0LKD9_9CHLO|nr:hypothetical protein CYMTET_4127 [Cymbomonas tetramitiformis]
MDALKTRVLEVRDIMEAELSPELFVIATHQLVHIPDQMRDEGPVPDLWMFAPESFFGELRRIIRTRSHPVASMMKGVELKRMVSLVRGLYQLLQANGSPPTISQPRSENTVSLMLATGNERKGKLVYSTPDDKKEIQAWLATNVEWYGTIVREFNRAEDHYTRNIRQNRRRLAARRGRGSGPGQNLTRPILHQPETWRKSPVTGEVIPFTEMEMSYALAPPRMWTEYAYVKVRNFNYGSLERDMNKATCHRYFKSVFKVWNVQKQQEDDQDRYGEILKVVKLVVHTDTYILVKCRWFPLEAALSDAVTQNIYLRTDMPWETKDAFIEAKDINNQVVVAPIPWKPLRLARYTGNKVPLNIRHRTDVLAVVLDRHVDFVGDIGDSSSDDED